MEAVSPTFEVIFNDRPVVVRELAATGSPLFLVALPDSKPLVITTATGADGQVFWTSVPEGRQAQAQALGKLIEAYFRKKN